MKIYFIQKEGTYLHGVHGIFTDKNIAIDKCKYLAKKDVDEYHEWTVIETETDILAEGDEYSYKAYNEGFNKVIFRTDKNY